MTQIFNRSCDKETRQRLRRDSPLPEQRLWLRLRNRRLLGYRFRQQYGVGPYALDFYCPGLKLAIEVDGDSHFHAGASEHDRDPRLALYQSEVSGRLDDVAGGIAEVARVRVV